MEIVDVENIKNYLYIILSCIVSFARHKYNKISKYIKNLEIYLKKIMIMVMLYDYTTIGILVRLGDKVRGTENLYQKNNPNFESIDDSLFDSFIYVILALMLI